MYKPSKIKKTHCKKTVCEILESLFEVGTTKVNSMHRQIDTKAEEKISIPPRGLHKEFSSCFCQIQISKRWSVDLAGSFCYIVTYSVIDYFSQKPSAICHFRGIEIKFCHPPLVHHKLTWTTHVEKGYRRPANPRTPMDIPKNSTITITCDWRGRAKLPSPPHHPPSNLIARSRAIGFEVQERGIKGCSNILLELEELERRRASQRIEICV